MGHEGAGIGLEDGAAVYVDRMDTDGPREPEWQAQFAHVADALVRQARKRHGCDDARLLDDDLVRRAWRAERLRQLDAWRDGGPDVIQPGTFFMHAYLLQRFLARIGGTAPPVAPLIPAFARDAVTAERLSRCMVDLKGVVLYANTTAAAHFAVPDGRALVGADSICDMVAPWDHARARENVHRALEGAHVLDEGYTIRTLGGGAREERPVVVDLLHPLRDDDDAVVGMVVHTRRVG